MTDRESARAPRSGEEAHAQRLLVLLVVCFAVFAGFAVPRLTNNVFGDLELTGWSGPFGQRILRGDVPYVDFVLPIPPGSFLILALVQKLAGRALVLQELWLIAICQLGMALCAYAIVRPFASRHTSLLVAFTSLVTLLQSQRECAFDATAELCAWISIALGSNAFVCDDDKKRRVALAAAGAFAGMTFWFEHGTATGLFVGWLVAFAYLALVDRSSRPTNALKSTLGAFAAGLFAGLLLLVGTLYALGSNLGAYAQAVLVDSTRLRGGASTLLSSSATSALGSAAFPSSLLVCIAIAFVVIRMARNRGLGSASDEASLDRRASLVIASLVVFVFGSACVLLATHVTRIPDAPLYYLERLARLPSIGLFFACLFFALHLTRSNDSASIFGHRQNAMLLVALATSLLRDVSPPNYRPFSDNDPIIPFSFAYLFLALGRARLEWCRGVVFALCLLTLFSTKLDRAFRAQARVGSTSHWAGMRINKEGIQLLGAALRVQELAAENETVLVLPEDPELVSLIDRPRPRLAGGVVFFDRYPARLAARDVATLLEQPPRVLVIRPRDRRELPKELASSSSSSGTNQLMDAVLDRLLPARYRLDRSVITRLGDRAVPLEIWVQKD